MHDLNDCPHVDTYRVGPTARYCRACSSTVDGGDGLDLDLVLRAHIAGRHLEARRLAAQVLAGHPPTLPGMPPA